MCLSDCTIMNKYILSNRLISNLYFEKSISPQAYLRLLLPTDGKPEKACICSHKRLHFAGIVEENLSSELQYHECHCHRDNKNRNI